MVTNNDEESRGGWCFFHSEAEPYAVKVGSVAEVVRLERVVRVPFAPPRLIGLFILRRNVIPIFRPREDGTLQQRFTDGKSLVLLIRATNGIWGLLIDRDGLQIREGIYSDDSQSDNGSTPDRVFADHVSHSVIDPDKAWQELLYSMKSWYAARASGQLNPVPG